ncbi:MAG: MFS transporter [Acidobacteriota bacterium]
MNDTNRHDLSQLWVLMVSAFVSMLGFALILPLVPLYAQELGASGLVVGAMLAAFAFAQLVTAPLWGRLSDRIGRRPVIILGKVMATVAFLIFAFADQIWLLLLCRFFQGAGGGTLSATQAYVSDAVGPDERAKALGWITACTSAGVMIGPAIGSLSVGWGMAAPGLIAAAISAINLVFLVRYLPEHRVPTSKRASARAASVPLTTAMLDVLRHPTTPVSVLIAVYGLGMMAFMAMNAVVAIFLADRYGITTQTIGWFYVAIGFVSVIMRGLILGAFVRRFGEVRTLRLGLVALGVGLLLAPFASNAWLFTLLILPVPVGTALLFPTVTSLVSRHAPADQVGQTLGVQQAFGGVCRLIAPLGAGWAYDHVLVLLAGAVAMAAYLPAGGAPFWLAGLLALLAVPLSLHLRPRADADEVDVEAGTAPAAA